MKIALHTLHVCNYPDVIAVSMENKTRYAAIRGYDLHAQDVLIDPARPPGWNRLQGLLRLLPQYDWILSVSQQALITNYARAVEQLVDDRCDLIVSEGPSGPIFNQMLIRNTPAIRALLDEVCAGAAIADGPMGEHAALLAALRCGKAGARWKICPRAVFCPAQATWKSPDDFIIDVTGAPDPRRAAHFALSLESIIIQHRGQFGGMFAALGLLGTGAEVGVEAGRFSGVLRGSWPGNTLYLIDPWQNSAIYADVQNVNSDEQDRLYQSVVAGFRDDPGVKVVRATSLQAAATFQDGALDWVYIDGDHSYKGVVADLHAWYPKVRRGGIVAGHDYADGFPVRVDPPQWNSLCGNFGVRTAVTEFTEGRNLRVYQTGETSGDAVSWYFVKV